jgi:lysophospholipase L1-like esterase
MAVRVCFFGDSFVNGTGDDDCLGWVGRLCAAERHRGEDLTLYNLGVRRDTSADIRRRWRGEATARLASDGEGRLVFSFGLNDCAPGPHGAAPRVSAEEGVDNARAILAEAADWLPTLMIGPPPVTDSADRNQDVIARSERLAGLCSKLRVPFLSTVTFARAIYPTWRAEADAGDGIHPNAESYAALADLVRRWPAWQAWFSP